MSDDALELNGLPGQLCQIDTVNEATRMVMLKTAGIALDSSQRQGVDRSLASEAAPLGPAGQYGQQSTASPSMAATSLLEDGDQG